jgi:hypothetical protein
MCALLVGLPDVVVVDVAEWSNWLRVLIEVPSLRPECGCGGRVRRARNLASRPDVSPPGSATKPRRAPLRTEHRYPSRALAH